MASVLSEIARETEGRAIIGLVPIHDRELVRIFGIKRIPTIIVIRDTQLTASFVGIVPKAQIERLLKGT